MAAGDIYKVAVVSAGSFAGQTGVFTMHYKQDTLFLTDNAAQALAESMEQKLTAELPAVMSVAGLANTIQVRGITQPTHGFDLSIAIAGGVPGEMLPPQDTAVVRWHTGLVGRSFRGRVFLPFSSEGVQTSGVWSTAYLTSLQNFGDAMLTLFDTVTGLVPWFSLQVFSKTLNIATPVISASVNSIVKTQRRRSLGVGS